MKLCKISLFLPNWSEQCFEELVLRLTQIIKRGNKMKKLLITTVLLASFTLSAEEPTVNANCSTIETLSREIMTSRQVGVPLSKMLEITPHGTLGRKLTIIAYSSPVYSTVQYQQRAINNFANEALLECVKLGE